MKIVTNNQEIDFRKLIPNGRRKFENMTRTHAFNGIHCANLKRDTDTERRRTEPDPPPTECPNCQVNYLAFLCSPHREASISAGYRICEHVVLTP